MTHLRVTAVMGSPVVELDRWPLMLDGPLSWAWFQRHDWHPFGGVGDADLPLARWDEGGLWGWRTSQAVYEPLAYTSVEIRRKPDLRAFARFTRDKKFHSALGPHKARDVTLSATWARTLEWQVEATDQDALVRLLDTVTGIGKLAAHGYGRVLDWQVADGEPDGWRDRPMPSTHGAGRAYRAPYHAPTRRVAA